MIALIYVCNAEFKLAVQALMANTSEDVIFRTSFVDATSTCRAYTFISDQLLHFCGYIRAHRTVAADVPEHPWCGSGR